MACLKTLTAIALFVWAWSWWLIRKARLSTPAWEALDRLEDAPRAIVYDPNGRRVCQGFRNKDRSVTIKMG